MGKVIEKIAAQSYGAKTNIFVMLARLRFFKKTCNLVFVFSGFKMSFVHKTSLQSLVNFTKQGEFIVKIRKFF